MSTALGYILLCLLPVFLYLFVKLLGKIEESKIDKLIKQAQLLNNRYPFAFRQVFGDDIEGFNKEKLQRILSESEDRLRDLERDHKELELKQKEEQKRIIETIAELESKYPHGIKRFCKGKPSVTDKEIVQSEGIIKEYEYRYSKLIRSKQWNDAQQEFSQKSRESALANKCGGHLLEVPYEEVNEEGDNIKSTCHVWLHSFFSYCNDDSLDYTWAPSLQRVSKRVKRLINGEDTIPQSVFDDLISFIVSLPNKPEVIFADDLWAEYSPTFYFKIFQYFREQLENNGIEYWDFEDLESFHDLEKRHYFVIVELFTRSQSAEGDLAFILDTFSSNMPCLTFFSIFRELSIKEAEDIIDKRERKALEVLKQKIKALKEKYPLASDFYIKKYPNSSAKEFVNKEPYLEELEQILSQIKRYRERSEKQAHCYNETKKRIESEFNNWECHDHYVQSTVGNDEVSEAFLLSVPHIELYPFSYDGAIDDSIFPSYKARVKSVSSIEKNDVRIAPSFMKKVLQFIKQYPTPRVFFGNSGRRDKCPNLNQYHFSALRNLLKDEGIPFCDVPDDMVLKDTTNDTLIIIELISSADTVSTNSSKVLLAHDTDCCLVYFSFWHEVSPHELSLIAEQKDNLIVKPNVKEALDTTILIVQPKSPVLKQNYQGIKDYLEANNVFFFFHFTDIRNIDSIKENGGLYSWRYCEEHNIKIENAGGDETSRSLDKRHKLEDYVRLSFCTDHPMAWRLKQDGSTLVLLKIKSEVAWLQGTLFSDLNATDNNHHHGPSIEDLKRIDINATRSHYLSKESDLFKKHQAEVLVKTWVPLEYIVNIDNPYLI